MKYWKVFTVIAVLVLSIFIITSCSSKKPEAVNQVPEGQQSPHTSMSQEVSPSEIGTPTVIPAGTDLKDYVKNYYQAYLAGEWEEAYQLLPAISKARETTQQFQESRSQMPIESYSIGSPVETQKDTTTVVSVPVEVKSSGMQFQTSWVFEKRKDGSYILKETVTALGGQ